MEKKIKKHSNAGIQNGFANEDVSSGISWREWKKKKKEQHMKWNEKKLQKLQEKEQKNQSSSSTNAAEISVKLSYTVSIAVPGSILDNAQSPELKTYLAGQIARAAAVFNVTEVVVYSEFPTENTEDLDLSLKLHKKNHGCVQLVRILQYLECPQYLRKYYFPMHKDLEYAGLLNPLDIPHHLRVDDVCKYREGVVMNKPVKDGKGSYVYIGLQKSAVIDKVLEPNIRVTVQLDDEQTSKKHFKGKAVPPTAPYRQDGIYWGYNVRLAKSLRSVFSESSFKGGYDLTIGTSDKGNSIDSTVLPAFKHLLIVFGGLKGIEASLESDELITADEPSELFDVYLNTCPTQGSRTIRTEEAILITLSALRPKIMQLQRT